MSYRAPICQFYTSEYVIDIINFYAIPVPMGILSNKYYQHLVVFSVRSCLLLEPLQPSNATDWEIDQLLSQVPDPVNVCL